MPGDLAHFTVVDTVAGIVRRASSCSCEDAHGDHGYDHDEDEGQADPHVWLSPPLLKTMAANVAAALCQADPRHEPVYRSNLKTLQAELDALDRRIAQSLLPYRGQAFYVFHPAFGYFADAYGLRQEPVEVEGKPPTPRQIFGLINKARDDHVKIIFLQPQFNQQIAASIAQAIGGAVMPMDDLAFDVVANLDDVAKKIAASNREKTRMITSPGDRSPQRQLLLPGHARAGGRESDDLRPRDGLHGRAQRRRQDDAPAAAAGPTPADAR